MGAQRAAWQVAFRAESAALNHDHYAQPLLDVVKAFERVPHDRVVASAKKHSYNLCVLRLTFAAYRMQRSIGVNGSFGFRVLRDNGGLRHSYD